MLSLRRHRHISLLLLLLFALLAVRLLQINYSHAADYTAQVQRQRLWPWRSGNTPAVTF